MGRNIATCGRNIMRVDRCRNIRNIAGKFKVGYVITFVMFGMHAIYARLTSSYPQKYFNDKME